MGERSGVTRVLIQHFFRRFFDNDTIQVDGDTQTTVVRALSIVAVPGLMVAFFLQNQYPQRSQWGAIADHYFFVLFSLVVMGAISIFEWNMLFPDLLDFLILSPLPIRPMQLLAAKAVALTGFLLLFLVSCNLFGAIVLSAVSGGDLFRQLYSHATAVMLAGVFAALFFLAMGGVLLCVLSAAWFRAISPAMQTASVMVLVVLMLLFPWFGASMHSWLSGPLGKARWIPPLWFLGVYEQLLRGNSAPAFAREMARYAVRGTAIAAALVLLTYPMAWSRMRRTAVEGSSRRRRRPLSFLTRIVHAFIRSPAERAVIHFISQTMTRNNRYQVYLAMYCGVGLALAAAFAVTFRLTRESVQLALSNEGLHAMMPLLLFWVIAGLRTAFAFPLNMSAAWVFRITGVRVSECAAAARRWVLLCAMCVMCCILAILRAAGWDAWHLLVQAVCGLCLCILLTDGFFFFRQSVPFCRPRMPGRTSLPLTLTLYVGVFPPFIFSMIDLEMQIEKKLWGLLLLGFSAVVIHAALGLLHRGPDEIEEEMEGYEGEFQLLGLS